MYSFVHKQVTSFEFLKERTYPLTSKELNMVNNVIVLNTKLDFSKCTRMWQQAVIVMKSLLVQ